MDPKNSFLSNFAMGLLLGAFLVFSGNGEAGQMYAAEPAIIAVEPTAASHRVGEPFTVAVKVTSAGSPFIVVEATVSVSQNLTVEDLTFGDCAFTFVKTPTVQNPSFTGGIPGGSSEGCTVYSMTLKPTATGTGTITISNGAVKSSVDTSELLGLYQNGNYVFSNTSLNAAPSPFPPTSVQSGQQSTPQTQSSQTQIESYTVTVAILGENGTAAKGDSVVLYSGDDGTVVGTAQTDENGQVILKDVLPGTYNIVVARGTEKVAEQIITVSGESPEMKFTLKTAKSLSGETSDTTTLRNTLLTVFLLAIIAAGAAAGWYIWSKKRKNVPPPQTTKIEPPTNG